MTLTEIKYFTYYEVISSVGGFISSNLFVYGFITSLFLPFLFYNKLSRYLLKEKSQICD